MLATLSITLSGLPCCVKCALPVYTSTPLLCYYLSLNTTQSLVHQRSLRFLEESAVSTDGSGT